MKTFFGYRLLTDLTGEGAGTCLWGFGEKDGSVYFIKKFLKPKYPYEDYVLTPEKIERNKKRCRNMVQKKLRIYDAVNRLSDGNDVRIHEFFRVEQSYYLTMEKVDDLKWSVNDVYSLPETERSRLCALIAHAVARLHTGGLAHSDLKHDNVLFTRTENGMLTAKVIDFDSAFFETDDLRPEEISGDQVYFSPEAIAFINGMDARPGCKADVFALGVLFHQYFSGEVPGFDSSRCDYCGEAALSGQRLRIAPVIPPDVRTLLGGMLATDPGNRPTTQYVYEFFQKRAGFAPVTEHVDLHDDDLGPVRYCIECGRRHRSEAYYCPECAAKRSGKDHVIDPDAFFHPGTDLLRGRSL